MRTVELIQGTPEWHSWRKKHIGGSDAPVVEDISPYRTPRELYFERTGELALAGDEDANEFIFAKGHKTEALIRREFQELTRVEMKPLCVEHEKLDFMAASLDGFDPSMGVLEAKLVGQDVLSKARDGEIPVYHRSQILHCLEVTGADIGHWFGHDGKKHGVLVEVRLDREYIKRLIDKEAAFMEMLRNATPPPLSLRDYLVLAKDPILAELREAKEHADNAKAAFEATREKALKYVATLGHPKIAGEGLQIYQVIKQGTVDWLTIPEIEALKASLDPAYAEKFRKSGSTSWTVAMAKQKAVRG